MWRRIIKGLNAVSEEPIEGLTAHVFRHNYATELCYIGLPHSHEKKEFHRHIYYIKRKKEPDIASFLFISTKYRVLFFLRLRGLEPRTP